MSLAVIVLTHNRADRLAALLAALGAQDDAEFEVIVADDGSTDHTRPMIADLARQPQWRGRLSLVGPTRATGRRGHVRNQGWQASSASAVVLCDSDVMLDRQAVTHLRALHERAPEAVILPRVVWLPPMPDADALDQLERNPSRWPTLVPKGPPRRHGGTFVGGDLRLDLEHADHAQPGPLQGRWTLSCCALWPHAALAALAGFDATFEGYGYEDIDLGLRAEAAGLSCIATTKPTAAHLWHPRDWTRHAQEEQANLRRCIARHGPRPDLTAHLT